eukprot:GDKJ01023483.1.p1 GENE.GDKJ01023483.1~~GDKJ01023483.1.p1  ORF type:complete len:346 (+),score=33.95 GDKJ01023483.1:10-1047(+)
MSEIAKGFKFKPEESSAMAHNEAIAAGSTNYKILNCHLAQGSYGTIATAIDLKTCTDFTKPKKSDYVAIKRSSRDVNPTNSNVLFAGVHFTILREIAIMNEIRHENIMGVRDVYTNYHFVYMVMDLMDGDLRKFVGRNKQLTEPHIKCLMWQILCGLDAMHKWSFIHRDLTPANIFCTDEGICKIGDFGLCRRFGSPGREMTNQVVTIWYRAPELLFGATEYSAAVDMWSAGCIFGELLRGRALFTSQGENPVEMLGLIFDVLGTPKETNWPTVKHLPLYTEFTAANPKPLRQFFPAASDACLDLLKGLLCLDPSKRLTAEQALQHHFFKVMPRACHPSELPRDK